MQRAFAVALLLAGLTFPREAAAYCFSTACRDGSSESCDGAELDPGCFPLRWKAGCVGFSIQRDGVNVISTAELDAITRTAFSAWASLDCGGGDGPGFVVQDLGEVTCNRVEYNSDAGNANVIMVRETSWPHPPSAGHDIALTTTTFDPDTGELLDADMEINAAEFHLTTNDTEVDYDLQSVLTHEAGHFLGLAHSMDPSATMRPVYESGNLELRQPILDDTTGICTVYPPSAKVDASCNPLPRHGFSPECKGAQTEGSCSAAPSTHGGWVGPLLVVALALVNARRRSKDRSARRLPREIP